MDRTKVMDVRFSSSPFDERYNMAYLYCTEKGTGYVFSLSRFPDSPEIEVMVVDQRVHRVTDLSVELRENAISVKLSNVAARNLDGYEQYVLNLGKPEDGELRMLKESLEKLFEGKTGLALQD